MKYSTELYEVSFKPSRTTRPHVHGPWKDRKICNSLDEIEKLIEEYTLNKDEWEYIRTKGKFVIALTFKNIPQSKTEIQPFYTHIQVRPLFNVDESKLKGPIERLL